MERISYRLTIKDMPETERPRERLCSFGPTYLSDAELIAIILGTGSDNETALDLAIRLLDSFNREGGLESLLDTSVEELRQYRGMGTAKACKLIAAAELTRRIRVLPSNKKSIIKTPRDAVNLVMEEMRYLKKEYFKVMLLNAKNAILSIDDVSIGSLNASVVHPRELFKLSIKRSAAAVILLHNHPSGDPSPSQEDINITKRICSAGEIIGIDVLDHIIIGNGIFLSFKEKGII